MRQREEGVCYAYAKGDGPVFIFQPDEFERLKADWMAGKAFFEGKGFYGGDIAIKLGDINAVNRLSPESMRLCREDDAAERREDAMGAL